MGDSTLFPTLFYGAANSTSAFYQGVDPAWAPWLLAAIWTGVALVTVLVAGPELGRQPVHRIPS